jgi:hypothetical protein
VNENDFKIQVSCFTFNFAKFTPNNLLATTSLSGKLSMWASTASTHFSAGLIDAAKLATNKQQFRSSEFSIASIS